MQSEILYLADEIGLSVPSKYNQVIERIGTNHVYLKNK